MYKYFKEAKSILLLGIPIILAQFSQTAMGFIDTIMAGKVSEIEMSAVALGTSIWLPSILFGHGLLMALTPIISELNGSKKNKIIKNYVQQGMWLAFFLSLFIMFILYNSYYIINNIPNIDLCLAKKSKKFLHAIMWGAPGYLFYQVYRSQCDGLSNTKPGMFISFIGLLINIPINYIFIYGRLGAPKLGGVGCAIATSSVYWLMFFLIYWYIHIILVKKNKFCFKKRFIFPNLTLLKSIFFLGLPIGLAYFFEVTLFSVVALLIAPLGIIAVASHQIALNFSSLMFMFPISLGIAATIRVGFNLGLKSIEKAKISAYTSIVVGLFVAFFTGILTGLFRKKIALMYNHNPEVISLASNLIFYAAIYQISDALQVIGAGILRGYKDTRAIFFITFIAYWILGLPIGYILGLTNWLIYPLGARGFWIGFIIGLTASAIMMIARILWIQNKSNNNYLL
ncbi:MAG: MATE family efflux transporter [Arsenophonus sp.]|nr:MAG: MATE family efflux transporter [Arsenophonus sp.]